MTFRATLGLLLLLSPTWAMAEEFYGLNLGGSCGVEIGVITRVQGDMISLLKLDGKSIAIPAESVKTVFVFNSIESPLTSIEYSDKLIGEMKAVYVEQTAEPRFYGWPVRFIDNLVVFSDVNGKSHVYDLETIFKIRSPQRDSITPLPGPPKGKEFSFDLHDFLPECRTSMGGKANSEVLRPTRTMADQIRVRQFFDDLERGYDRLENLQQRTLFYARPLLYDQKARLGFISIQNGREVKSPIPAYISFSTGRPFRFQSFAVVGAHIHDHLPAQEPGLVFRSDVKAHLFHAHFSGNLSAFSGGTPYYTADKRLPTSGEELGLLQGEVHSTFNYIALMGFDYGPFSISAGRYYPIYGFRMFKEMREVRSRESTPMFDLGYTDLKLKVLMVISPSNKRESKTPTSDDIGGLSRLSSSTFDTEFKLPSEFRFDSGFWRLGADYQIMEKLKVGASLFFLATDYREKTATAENFLFFRRRGLTLSVRQEFGDYIALAVLWNNSKNSFDFKVNGQAFNGGDQYSQLGGAFEFIF